ncbi:MAG: DUF370 domain-containing protein [Dehalococcoidia bacterium]
MAQQSPQRQLGAELVHAGFGNFIAMNRVVAIVTPGSAPIQRLIRDAKKSGTIIDQTSGRRTKAAVFVDTGQVILLAITPEAVAGRVGAIRLSRPAKAE